MSGGIGSIDAADRNDGLINSTVSTEYPIQFALKTLRSKTAFSRSKPFGCPSSSWSGEEGFFHQAAAENGRSFMEQPRVSQYPARLDLKPGRAILLRRMSRYTPCSNLPDQAELGGPI